MRLRVGSRRAAIVQAAMVLCAAFAISTAASRPAHAVCTPDSATAQTGDSVLCTGTTPGGFTAGPGVEQLEIQVDATATIQNGAAGDAAIQINTHNPGDTLNPTIPGVLIERTITPNPPGPDIVDQGLVDITGDGSAGVRATGSGGPTDLNYVRNEGIVQNIGGTPGNDVVGIDLGDRGRVEHAGTIELLGLRNTGIRVGADGNVTIETDGLITHTAASAGDDFIAVDAGDGSLVDHQGTTELLGPRSVGIRVGDDASVSNAGTIQNLEATPGDDVIGIDAGARSSVTHIGSIQATGARNVGIRAGDDAWVSAESGSRIRIGNRGSAADDDLYLDPVAIAIGNALGAPNPTMLPRGIDISGNVVAVGLNARGVVVGSDWLGANGDIRIQASGFVGARGTDAIALEVGDDNLVVVEGTIQGVGGTAIYMGDQTVAGPDGRLVVLGSVLASSDDTIGVSLGSKAGAVGDTLENSVTPSMELGQLSTATVPGIAGSITGGAVSGPLVLFRDAASELNHLVISDGSVLQADESIFFEPGRAIAIQGSDGRERIDNYGVLGGKVLLAGGNDRFLLGPTGSFVGDMNVNGGDGIDTLELSNRWAVPYGGSEAGFDFDDYRNFERLVVDDATPRRATGSSDNNALEYVEITPGSALIVTNPLALTGGSDQIFVDGAFVGGARLGSGNDFVSVGPTGAVLVEYDGQGDIAIPSVIDTGDGADALFVEGFFAGEAQLGNGNDTFTVLPGGVLLGPWRIDGGAGTDAVLLGGDSTGNVYPIPEDAIAGLESLRIAADGRWSLAGDYGSLNPGGAITVAAGGELVARDALQLDGDLDFEAGSTLRLELRRTDQPAILRTTGDITIEEDNPDLLTSTLDLTVSGSLDAGRLVLLQGASLTGEFDVETLPTNPVFTFTNLTYDALAGTLTVDIDREEFPHNREVTNAYLSDIDGRTGTSPELQQFIDALYALPADEYVETLDLLHPETYDAQTSVQLALARQFQQTLLERPSHCIAPAESRRRDPRTRVPCRPRPVDVWATGYGLFRSRDGQVGNITWDDSGGGLVLGADHRRGDSLLLSASLGGARATSDVERVGDGRFTALDAGALAAWKVDQLLVQGFVTYGHGWHQAYRNVAFSNVRREAEGEYQSNRVSLGGELSWTFALDGLDIAPVFDVDWALVKRPSFTETDAAPVNLHVETAKDSVTTIRLGFDLGTSWLKKGYWTDFLESTDGVWQPSLSLKWRQVIGGGESRAITSNIAGAPPVTGTTTVLSDDAKQGVEIGAGVWFTPKKANRISIGARYDAFVWQDVVSHDLLGTVMYSFF